MNMEPHPLYLCARETVCTSLSVASSLLVFPIFCVSFPQAGFLEGITNIVPGMFVILSSW